MNVRPPAVTMGPPNPGRPVRCFPSGKLSVTPRTDRHAISPLFTSTPTSSPQGGSVHGRCFSGFLRHDAHGLAEIVRIHHEKAEGGIERPARVVDAAVRAGEVNRIALVC